MTETQAAASELRGMGVFRFGDCGFVPDFVLRISSLVPLIPDGKKDKQIAGELKTSIWTVPSCWTRDRWASS